MVTDWRQNEDGDWIYSNGPGRVEKWPAGKWWAPNYDGDEFGLWSDLQNAMLIVEMKHREVTLAAEVREVEGLL